MTHDDYCRLSRVFNEGADLRRSQDYNINEWLKRRIAEHAPSSVARDGLEAQWGLNDTFPGDPVTPPLRVASND